MIRERELGIRPTPLPVEVPAKPKRTSAKKTTTETEAPEAEAEETTAEEASK